MKRRDFCTTTGAIVAALALPVRGQEESSEPAAVKVDLYEVGDDGGLTDQVAGWIVANTTAAGLLIVEVHLDQGDPLTWFDVFITINQVVREEDMALLVTNDQGMGNTHAVARLDDYPGDPNDDYVFFGVDIWWSVEE